ncbi:MAG: hypothetical protein KBD63_07650 [Bacteriovoracaceae bacterium]|nr:hypothetical protein [Bacteriovoracaceae bacterium]
MYLGQNNLIIYWQKTKILLTPDTSLNIKEFSRKMFSSPFDAKNSEEIHSFNLFLSYDFGNDSLSLFSEKLTHFLSTTEHTMPFWESPNFKKKGNWYKIPYTQNVLQTTLWSGPEQIFSDFPLFLCLPKEPFLYLFVKKELKAHPRIYSAYLSTLKSQVDWNLAVAL